VLPKAAAHLQRRNAGHLEITSNKPLWCVRLSLVIVIVVVIVVIIVVVIVVVVAVVVVVISYRSILYLNSCTRTVQAHMLPGNW
jgi:hypothetical protein